MSDPIDLSDVDPLKWAEVTRRVQVVRGYLAIRNPTVEDRERHAAMLNLGIGQFYNLVRAWRTHRRPSALGLGVRKTARPSVSRRGGVDPRAREIAREVIAEMGRDAPPSDIAAAASRRCLAEGIVPPSVGTIRLLVKEVSGAPDGAAPTGLLVARTFVRLPTILDGEVELPAAIVVAEVPSGRVLELVLVDGDEGAAMPRIVSAVRRGLDGASLHVVAMGGDADVLEEAIPSLRCTRRPPAAIDRLLASTVGGRIGHVELRVRRPSGRLDTVMQSARDQALTPADSQRALDYAAANQNRALAEASSEPE